MAYNFWFIIYFDCSFFTSSSRSWFIMFRSKSRSRRGSCFCNNLNVLRPKFRSLTTRGGHDFHCHFYQKKKKLYTIYHLMLYQHKNSTAWTHVAHKCLFSLSSNWTCYEDNNIPTIFEFGCRVPIKKSLPWMAMVVHIWTTKVYISTYI